VRPGLSGLAQISGRNGIAWEDKLSYDLAYIRHITFWGDLKIVLTTILKVLRTESISHEGMATAEDMGDYLLRTGKITRDEYRLRQQEAHSILKGTDTCSMK
ncbi:MAG: sugar transferase, partial [Firmicutes bacterium]|nr:sugar transferase [Bacillota bacterium]